MKLQIVTFSRENGYAYRLNYRVKNEARKASRKQKKKKKNECCSNGNYSTLLEVKG